jgi:GTP-binding protein
MTADGTAAFLEAGRLLFAGPCDYVVSAVKIDQLPAPRPVEVAFAGRSNVGKSSLINALTGRKTLARISNTPGRTRALNFFALGDRAFLVDMPGYGYARAPKAEIRAWTALIERYLAGRAGLARVFLLIDARHGAKPSDMEVMSLMDRAAVAYQGILTKIDAIPAAARRQAVDELAAALAKRPAAHPRIIATSARGGEGIAELRAEIAELAEAVGPR